jgi:Uma2 family endonuclease
VKSSLEDLILQADHTNVRLEFIAGFHVWEEGPTLGHQLEVDRIRASIATTPHCLHLNDVLFRFSDGSLTHPDIAILSRRPNDAEMTKALTITPEAVIEVISEGYEKKDLELAPSFYLSVDVKDVIIFEPSTLIVYHYRKDGSKRLESPVKIALECGCTCEV